MFAFSAVASVWPNCTGRKPTALAERKSKLSGYWIKAMAKNNEKQVFMLCIENKDCEDLERRKIYQVLHDSEASQEGYVRVIDASGKDYLYPESYFISSRKLLNSSLISEINSLEDKFII